MAREPQKKIIGITCEKCGKRQARREYLIMDTQILYLCEDCAKLVMPFIDFLDEKEGNK